MIYLFIFLYFYKTKTQQTKHNKQPTNNNIIGLKHTNTNNTTHVKNICFSILFFSFPIVFVNALSGGARRSAPGCVWALFYLSCFKGPHATAIGAILRFCFPSYVLALSLSKMLVLPHRQRASASLDTPSPHPPPPPPPPGGDCACVRPAGFAKHCIQT